MHIRHATPASPRAALGFTLVELMISLVLGLIVTSAALAMFLANKQVYTTSEHLGRVQENVRTAYEVMSREMRESTGTACEANLKVANVLRSSSNWWLNFDNRIKGFDGATAFPGDSFGTTSPARIAGTDAVELKSGLSDSVTVVSHNTGTATFKVGTVNHGFRTGDLALVCDFKQAALLQITAASNGTTDTLQHVANGSFVPGNCTTGLLYASPTLCSSPGNVYPYPALSQIAHVHMSRWYIGVNPRGGRSLYQATVVNTNGAPSVQIQEIADGVQDMELSFLLAGANDYVPAGSVTAFQWAQPDAVVAVRIVLDVEVDEDTPSGEHITRRLEHTVTLRNRLT
jgi:type IV pilus assembly protein PilW